MNSRFYGDLLLWVGGWEVFVGTEVVCVVRTGSDGTGLGGDVMM